MNSAFFTKGYLTGGIYPSMPEEWEALYRLEGARRRWRRHRARHQYANAYSWGVEPYVVTYRHVWPNPVYVQRRADEAEKKRAWQAAYAEGRERRRAAAAERREERAAHWREMGWESSRDRAIWIVARLAAGDTQVAISGKAKLTKTSVSQILAAERRRRAKYKGPRGRIFELDNFYPRDAWITYAPEDDPNDFGDRV